MGLVVERACDQNIEVRVSGFARGGHEVGACHGAELGSDEDRGALLRSRVSISLQIAPLATHQVARPRRNPGKGDPVGLVGLLDPRCLQVFEDHRREVRFLAIAELRLGNAVKQLVVSRSG